MPQLDPNTFGSQLFWLALTFIALYVAMSFIALPRIGRTLQSRRTTIEGDIESAQKLQKQSEAALKAHEEALAQARVAALTLAEEVRKSMREKSDAQKAEVEAKLARAAQDAEMRLQTARGEALSHVQEAAIEIVPDVLGALGVKVPEASAILAAVQSANNQAGKG
ncbi:MAG: F0F1 ATP synthase subunit B' [Alphaproteobacteria bacterium]|nr:F0F1 ATP synthase subunit B' [Alphaproteobacteria bacterium]MBE8219855.1 F0F1 ATP synthase subunit B' [Alphaproteobacteria bacterium]